MLDKVKYAGHNHAVNKLRWTKHKNQRIACVDDTTISVWNLNFYKHHANNAY
ncbi:MAG: hypothetical protein MI674_00790 [Cytophagales bacterium]|nr:hypothetical protein [Cytophagales bacterium]